MRPALFFILIACSKSSTCDSTVEDTGVQIGEINPICRCEEASIAVGTGRDEFIPITAGDRIEMTYGPQGGWHIWGSIQAKNTRNVIVVRMEVEDLQSGERIVDVTHQIALSMHNECTGSYTGLYGFLELDALHSGELDTPPELICGHTLAIQMTVSDSGGTQLSQTVETIASPDPVDLENCLL